MATKGKNNMSDWPDRIRTLLISNSRTSIVQLAFTLGVKKDSLLDWLMGKSKPSAKLAKRIASMERSAGPSELGRAAFLPWHSRTKFSQKLKSTPLPPEGPLGYERYLDLVDEYSRACLHGTIGHGDADAYSWIAARSRGEFGNEDSSLQERKPRLASIMDRLNEAHRRFSDEIRAFPVTLVADREGWSPEEIRIAVHLTKADTAAFEGPGGAPGNLLVRIAGGPTGDRLVWRRLLAPTGKLRKSGLIERVMPSGFFMGFGRTESSSVLEGSYALSQRGRQELLGPLLEACVSEDKADGISRVTTPRYKLDAMVLPAGHRSEIGSVIAELHHRTLLDETWGLSKVVHYGRGLLLLLSGPPGTGKTMLAEALAGELGLKFMSASLDKIHSMWVGETAKNISRMFREAREAGALLFIDEADGLFVSRSLAQHSWELRDANVLLKEVEEFEGVCVLATNNVAVLDGALESRVSLRLEFAMPDADARLAIWKKHLPPQLPLAEDVNLPDLAQRYEISGRDIKQAVLAAARAAVARAGHTAVVTMLDLERAAAGRLNEAARIGFSPA